MKRFKKGSEAAKRYMAKIRGMRKGSHVSKSRASRPRHIKTRRTTSLRRRRYSRRNKGGGRGISTLPIAPIAGLACGIIPAIDVGMRSGAVEGLRNLVDSYLGYDFKAPERGFQWSSFSRGVTPLVVGLLIHKFVGGAPLNVNRMLGSAKIPVLRI